MSAPTRYPNGVTNVTPTSALSQYGLPDPSKWHTYFTDFDTYTASEWTVTEVGTPTQALSNEDGGVLLITNSGAEDDSSFQQKVGESYLFETNKKLIFKTRFKVTDATQSDVVFGLQITDTTPLDVSDGVFFIKSDETTAVDFVVEKDNTATTTQGITNLADDTYVNLAFSYNGKDEIAIYVDDAKVQSVATTNLPDVEELTISFGLQNGAASVNTMNIDYIFVAKER